MKYLCPACGFHIFNRRVDKCESCGAQLPAHLLYSREEIGKLDAQYQQSQKEREMRQRKEQERRQSIDGGFGYSGGADSSGFGDGCGDGGGD